jgi:uncharacterized OB-fold protein
MIDDPDTGGFFQAARRNRLAAKFCRACGAPIHLPRPFCPSCRSRDLEWRDLSPNGRVYSWTVVEHQVHPAFPVPYTILLIELDDMPGVRLVGNIAGDAVLNIGDPVRATFDPAGNEVIFPQWTVLDRR